MRSILLIVTALLLVGATFFVARGWLDSQRAQVAPAVAEQRPAGAQVLVASKDLPVGNFLKAGDLRWQSWPDDDLPESYMVKGTVKPEDFEGTVVRRSFSAGQPVTRDRIIKPGERGFLAAVLQAGYRAISIPIGAASGIAGLIFPGDRVDILLTLSLVKPEEDDSKGADPRATETVLTNVRVLALDQKVDDQSDEPKLAKTATLEVLPKQAEILSVAREMGSLSLSLRSLAKDQDELERIQRGEQLAQDPAPESGLTYTWDSEASMLVKDRTEAEAAGATISVARGKEIEEIKIERSK
jgi:pilus assembly protein CpaB